MSFYDVCTKDTHNRLAYILLISSILSVMLSIISYNDTHKSVVLLDFICIIYAIYIYLQYMRIIQCFIRPLVPFTIFTICAIYLLYYGYNGLQLHDNSSDIFINSILVGFIVLFLTFVDITHRCI